VPNEKKRKRRRNIEKTLEKHPKQSDIILNRTKLSRCEQWICGANLVGGAKCAESVRK